jgi:hypothetical protein
MSQPAALEIVAPWVAAANAQDIDRLLELSDPDIEIVGPRGTGSGHQLLREWAAHAGLTLETLRTFARTTANLQKVNQTNYGGRSGGPSLVTGCLSHVTENCCNTVVLGQRGIWRSPDSGQITGERTVASLFQTDDHHVVRFARFDSLDEALATASLTAADEIAPA